jgi:secondary thiamine-phosphate synthase enzyme
VIKYLSVATNGQGLYDLTAQLAALVNESGIENGLCTLFVQHTSASLIIQENADPAVQDDLHNWLNRLVAEHDPLYTHTDEGPDDMPAHIKSVLTATSLGVPVANGRLSLGTWQGIYLWEHRHRGSARRIVVHLGE